MAERKTKSPTQKSKKASPKKVKSKSKVVPKAKPSVKNTISEKKHPISHTEGTPNTPVNKVELIGSSAARIAGAVFVFVGLFLGIGHSYLLQSITETNQQYSTQIAAVSSSISTEEIQQLVNDIDFTLMFGEEFSTEGDIQMIANIPTELQNDAEMHLFIYGLGSGNVYEATFMDSKQSGPTRAFKYIFDMSTFGIEDFQLLKQIFVDGVEYQSQGGVFQFERGTTDTNENASETTELNDENALTDTANQSGIITFKFPAATLSGVQDLHFNGVVEFIELYITTSGESEGELIGHADYVRPGIWTFHFDTTKYENGNYYFYTVARKDGQKEQSGVVLFQIFNDSAPANSEINVPSQENEAEQDTSQENESTKKSEADESISFPTTTAESIFEPIELPTTTTKTETGNGSVGEPENGTNRAQISGLFMIVSALIVCVGVLLVTLGLYSSRRNPTQQILTESSQIN